MGGGGDPSSPGYHGIHKDAHAYMATGEDIGSTGGLGFPIVGGTLGMVLDADSASLGGSPYSFVSVFDPEQSGNRFTEMVNEIDSFLSHLDNIQPDTRWTEKKVELEARLAEADIAGVKSAISTNLGTVQDTRKSAKLSDLSISMFSFEANVGAVSKDLWYHLLDREKFRQQAEVVANLSLEDNIYKQKVIPLLTDKFLILDADYLRQRAEALTILTKTTDIWSTAVRQGIEDELRLTIEDAIWDLKLMDFSNKALSSIAGASVIPEGQMKENSGILGTISTLATTGAAIAMAV